MVFHSNVAKHLLLVFGHIMFVFYLKNIITKLMKYYVFSVLHHKLRANDLHQFNHFQG